MCWVWRAKQVAIGQFDIIGEGLTEFTENGLPTQRT